MLVVRLVDDNDDGSSCECEPDKESSSFVFVVVDVPWCSSNMAKKGVPGSTLRRWDDVRFV